jgi:hypothetical protein
MSGLMLLSVLAAATTRASATPAADTTLSSAQSAQPLLLPELLLHCGFSSTATAACSAFAAMSAWGSWTLPWMMNTPDSLQRIKQQQRTKT